MSSITGTIVCFETVTLQLPENSSCFHRTALHLACANGHSAVVTLLLERKCLLTSVTMKTGPCWWRYGAANRVHTRWMWSNYWDSKWIISFRYSKPVKPVACLLWIPRIYTLFLGTTLTGRRMPRRGVCDSSAGAWCRPKCHGRLWEHHSPLCCLLPEYITRSKAAFLRRQYRSQERGISQLYLQNIREAFF